MSDERRAHQEHQEHGNNDSSKIKSRRVVHNDGMDIKAATPMPLTDNLNVSKKNNSFNQTTASDVLHLKGERNTAKVRLSISYSENGTRSIEYPPSIEECIENDDEFRFQANNCRCLPKRYVLAILSFFGFFNVYCLRVDLSVALVAMTSNHTRMNSDGSEYEALADFDWDRERQGHLLAAFYYGYIITQIPGGYVAARFGGKALFGSAILISGILTLLTPMAAREHWVLLFVLRLIEGLCEGAIYPAMYALWSRWAPPMERAKLVTIPHSGSYAGSVAGTLISGYLCEVSGWSWVFYLFGIFAIMWAAVWQIMVSDSPEDDRHISKAEKTFIMQSLKNEHTNHLLAGSPPWLSIFTSLPFLAIAVAHTCEGWGFGLVQTSFPKYLSEAMNFRIFKSGKYTSLIYLLMGLSVFISGQVSDCLRQRNVFSATMARKVFTVIGFSSCAIVYMVSPNILVPEVSATIIVIGAGLQGIAWAGFGVNHLDIAPRYASVLIGITNTCATVPSIFVPIFVGSISGTGGRAEWLLIFYVSCGTFIFGALFYGLFSSAEIQSWAEDDQED